MSIKVSNDFEGKVWAYLPESRTLTDVPSNLTGQEFTGILIGDLSGS